MAAGWSASAPLAGDLWSTHLAEQDLREREAAILRDEQRLRDLQAISNALERYAELNGGFPITGQIQSLCNYPADAGCGLTAVLSPLPTNPRGLPYWYQSDGQRFMLYASTEELPHNAECPSPLPSHLAAIPRLSCLSGQLER